MVVKRAYIELGYRERERKERISVSLSLLRVFGDDVVLCMGFGTNSTCLGLSPAYPPPSFFLTKHKREAEKKEEKKKEKNQQLT